MSFPIQKLQALFGAKLQENVQMANYSTSRVGGPVLGLIPVNTLEEMKYAAKALWSLDVPFHLIGSGSNILVSDSGYDGVVLLNRCHNVKIHSQDHQPSIFAESGANLANVARQSALRGLSGLEWAASIPGSVGGAVYGNAGAFGSDISCNLRSADLLFRDKGELSLSNAELGFLYRSSIFKRERPEVLILSAIFDVSRSSREVAWAELTRISEKRQATQPPGPSTGSTFKNPGDEKAGRLIEAVGLKGHCEGHACFSQMHANFIVNDGNSCAKDYITLIQLAQSKVQAAFGIDLELEIELIGSFEND